MEVLTRIDDSVLHEKEGTAGSALWVAREISTSKGKDRTWKPQACQPATILAFRLVTSLTISHVPVPAPIPSFRLTNAPSRRRLSHSGFGFSYAGRL